MSSGPSAMSVKITTQFSITIVVTIPVQGTLTGAPAPEGEYGDMAGVCSPARGGG